MEKPRKVCVCLEHRFYSFNGRLYTKLAFGYPYWRNYLNYFSSVVIVARVKKVDTIDHHFREVTGPGVFFEPMPYYVGPGEFVRKLPSLIVKSVKIAASYDQFILRTGNVTNLIWLFLVVFRKKYLREYPGNIKEGITGFVGQAFWVRTLANFLHAFAKLQGRWSCANSFVSVYCSNLYGSRKPGYVFSSFNADEVDIKKLNTNDRLSRIVLVGRLEGEKGHSSVIEALSILKARGIHLGAYMIGDGAKSHELKRLAEDLGVECVFFGAITDRTYLFQLMAEADLFCIPSLTEGMPRSLLEAMAVGLPCIGSNVGGIPEVLSPQFLFEPNNTEAIIESIISLLPKGKRRQASLENRTFIEENFAIKELDSKKFEFWSKLYEK